MADIRDIQGYNYTQSKIPPQAIPLKNKDKHWVKATLDFFEREGVSQIEENMKFAEYNKMYYGNVSYMDFDEVPQNLETIKELRSQKELPTYYHHYDILGLFINTFVGEFMQLSDKYKVTNTDMLAENSYLREKSRRGKKYLIDSFNLEFEKILLELNIDTNKKFETEEEQQQYLAELQRLRDENKPINIDSDMKKTWQTTAAKWGQHILNKDKMFLSDITTDEAISYMRSGRYFRHYRIGYDNYTIEKWNVEETFFSQELDLVYPQKSEYVGRVSLMTPNQVLERFGHLMTAKQIETMSGDIKELGFFNEISKKAGFDTLQKSMYSKNFVLPFKGYDEYLFGKTLEDMSGIPMGTRINPDGTSEVGWIPDFNQNVVNGHILSSLRDDITVRTDVAQVTEVYWKSPKRIGLLTYIDNGIIKQEIVDDTILPEFLKAFGIKKVKTVSLVEAEKNPKINTIVYTYAPEVRWGVKINNARTFLEEDLYLGGEPLEYQIRGNSNLYEVLIPVGGIITEAPIKKIIPLQLLYNQEMNKVYSMSERELGLFYFLDWGMLGSEYKDMGTTEDALLALRESAKDLGFAIGDSTNAQYQKGNTMPPITPIDMSMSRQILEKLKVVESIKWMALEQFGISAGRLGGSTVHETAEGVKRGEISSFNQTAIHFNKMENANNRLNEIHLAVAQYAQKNNKDISVFYQSSDSDLEYLSVTDDNFAITKLGVIPTSDSKKAKQLENFKQAIFNSNTLGQDLLSFAETLVSENMSELINVARNLHDRNQKDKQAERQYALEMKDKELAAIKAEKDADRAFKDYELTKKLDSEEDRAYIKNLGNAVDNNADADLITQYDRLAKTVLDSHNKERGLNLQEKRELNRSKEVAENISLKQKQVEQKDRELDLREKDIRAKQRIAEVNKN